MTIAKTMSRLHRGLRRYARDSEGITAVEFGIILPFMVTLYLGSVELGDGLAIQFRATLAARTVADLTSQYTSVDAPTMSAILGAASTVVTPYPANNMVVTVSELQITNGNSIATVQWSCSLNGTQRAQGSSFTVPSTLASLPPGQTTAYVILGEVTYPYTPSMGYVITGTINMYQDSFFFPRMTDSVADNSAC
jgi:Flp pilus assembly protein TadG